MYAVRSIFFFVLVLVTTFAGCDETDKPEPSPDTSENADVAPDTTPDVPLDAEDTTDLGSPLDWAVDETGPYAVGFREVEVVHTPAPLTEERTLRVAIWYPTDAPTGDPVLYFGALESEIATIDAPPVGEDMPVLIFSHGHMGFAEATSFLCEHFASHGWIAIAPDHVGNTTTDLGKAVTAETYLWRPRDLSASLDWLYALPESDPLSGRVGDKVALAGHSFGGWTSFIVAGASFALESLLAGCEADEHSSQFCVNLTEELLEAFGQGLQDERVELIIPLDPGSPSMVGDSVSDIDMPILLMTADGPLTGKSEDHVSGYWELMDRSDAIWVNLTTAGHQSFGILCDIMPSFAEDQGCGEAFMPHEEAYEIINVYSLAFARFHFFGDTAMETILSGELSFSDAVEVHTK